MSKILRQNVDGTEFTMAGCALTGVCASSASDYVKVITLSDGDVLSDGMMTVITFANGNTAGNAPDAQTIYSSDQINFYSDSALTQPFTLAPQGCYDLVYSGSGNAYSYTSYPVITVGDITAPICDSCGKKTSGALWDAGDSVVVLFTSGKFLLLSVKALDTVTDGSMLPVTSNAVADIMSNLPTDAVLHYSFDEVPDYPDGSALDRNPYRGFTSTDNWIKQTSSNADIVLTDGVLRATTTSTQNIVFVKTNISVTSGMIFKCKLFASFSSTVSIGIFDGTAYSTVKSINFVANQEIEIVCVIPNATNYLRVYVANVSSGNYVELRESYIGDGSYSTPVIDNANGQNNSTSQSGVAVQGVSGKGIRFLGSNYIQGNLPWKPWYKQTFTMSIWVKGWDKTTILPLINTWFSYAVNSIGLWVETGANSIELDVPSSTGVQRFKIYKTRFDPTTLDEFCLTVVCNGANTKLYVNGEQIQLDTSGTSPIGDGQKEVQAFQIGRYKTQSSYDYGNAIVDDFLIFDRLLSETEVRALYLNKANTPKYYSWADWKLSQA